MRISILVMTLLFTQYSFAEVETREEIEDAVEEAAEALTEAQEADAAARGRLALDQHLDEVMIAESRSSQVMAAARASNPGYQGLNQQCIERIKDYDGNKISYLYHSSAIIIAAYRANGWQVNDGANAAARARAWSTLFGGLAQVGDCNSSTTRQNAGERFLRRENLAGGNADLNLFCRYRLRDGTTTVLGSYMFNTHLSDFENQMKEVIVRAYSLYIRANVATVVARGVGMASNSFRQVIDGLRTEAAQAIGGAAIATQLESLVEGLASAAVDVLTVGIGRTARANVQQALEGLHSCIYEGTNTNNFASSFDQELRDTIVVTAPRR
jgi:hypothetical protein